MSTIMRTEILSQAQAVERTIAHTRSLDTEIRALVTKHQVTNVIFFARGTSDNAAMYGFYLFANHCGLSATSGHPSLATAYHAAVSLKNTLAIGISQSGRTEEIVESLRWAKSAGAATIGITNTPASPIFSAADITVLTQAGEERAVPATKTFTSALAALAVIAEAIAPESFPNGAIDQLPTQINETFAQQQQIDQIASALKQQETAVMTGRGYCVAIASEIALKLQESCYLVSLGLSAADLQHGPKAIIDHRLPIIAFVAGPTSPVNNTVVELVGKLKQQASNVITFGPVDSGLLGDLNVVVPQNIESLMPILLAPPAQLMVEATAVAKGLNPDLPRGLTKVTQT